MTEAVNNTRPVVRVAAAGDLHLRPKASRRWRNWFEAAAGHADMLLIAGDLTNSGSLAEAQMAVEDLSTRLHVLLWGDARGR